MCSSIVHDSHDAEDITQNVFAKLMKAIHKYEPRQVPFSAWILRVARNAALDHMRARRQIPFEEVRTDDDGHEQVGFERSQCLRDALWRLPDEQREVLVLRHLAGLSPGEIAERLGKTEGSIHGLHHRGRAALQLALREMDAGAGRRQRLAGRRLPPSASRSSVRERHSELAVAVLEMPLDGLDRHHQLSRRSRGSTGRRRRASPPGARGR